MVIVIKHLSLRALVRPGRFGTKITVPRCLMSKDVMTFSSYISRMYKLLMVCLFCMCLVMTQGCPVISVVESGSRGLGSNAGSWARCLTLTIPLSVQMYSTSTCNAGNNPVMYQHPIKEGVERGLYRGIPVMRD